MSDLAQRIAALSPEKLALLERRLKPPSGQSGDLARPDTNGNGAPAARAGQPSDARFSDDELGEIEAVLKQHPAVHQAALMVRESGTGERRLVAYLVPDRQRAHPVWQLLRLQSEGHLSGRLRYELPNGMVIIHLNRSETEYVYREIFEEQSYLKHGISLPKGACIFDVGAHIGLFTLFVSQACQDAEIYAFEPIPPIFSALRLNTSVYGVNAKLFPLGIADEGGTAAFSYYPHASVLSGRYADAATERHTVKASLQTQQQLGVGDMALSDDEFDELLQARLTTELFTAPVKTLSQVIRENNVERIHLLKIDVEKSELDVLDGLDEEDWPKIRQLVVEVHDIEGRLRLITARLEARGYKLTVEQDAVLRETGIYNLYAIRPPNDDSTSDDAGEPTPQRASGGWSSPERLVNEVQQFITQRLPEHMRPESLVLLDALPLTTDGDVDRRALLSLDRAKPRLKGEFVAPITPQEEKLASIWAEILGVERVGVHDNFFELGGDWRQTARLISRVRQAFDLDLPVRTIFAEPTVSGFALVVTRAQRASKGSHPPISSSEGIRAEEFLSHPDRLSDEDVASYLNHLISEEGETSVDSAPAIVARNVSALARGVADSDMTDGWRGEIELLSEISKLADEDVDALLFSTFSEEEILRAHAGFDADPAPARERVEWNDPKSSAASQARAPFGTETRRPPDNLYDSSAMPPDAHRPFAQVYLDYMKALQVDSLTAQTQAAEAHFVYFRSLQEAWERGEEQGPFEEAYWSYEEALRDAQGQQRERLREAYLSYLRALQGVWMQLDVDTLHPGSLMAISHAMTLAANFAATTLDSLGMIGGKR
jgi:FkbM family methyltransferase